MIRPNGSHNLGDSHQWNLERIFVSDVIWIYTLPNQMALAAGENHCVRVEQSEFVGHVVDLLAKTPTEVAKSAMPFPDFVPEVEPFVRF